MTWSREASLAGARASALARAKNKIGDKPLKGKIGDKPVKGRVMKVTGRALTKRVPIGKDKSGNIVYRRVPIKPNKDYRKAQKQPFTYSIPAPKMRRKPGGSLQRWLEKRKEG